MIAIQAELVVLLALMVMSYQSWENVYPMQSLISAQSMAPITNALYVNPLSVWATEDVQNSTQDALVQTPMTDHVFNVHSES